MAITYYGWRRHPQSGDVYAVEVTDDERIVRAVGPVESSVPRTRSEARALVTNAASDADALDDGDWLDAQFREVV